MMKDGADTDFTAKLLASFKVEAEEHLETLSDGLLALEKGPSESEKAEILASIFRSAHSLKGAARAVGFSEIEGICQSLENVLASWKQGKIEVDPKQFDTLYSVVDLIHHAVTPGETSDPQAHIDLHQQLALILEETTQDRHEPVHPHSPYQPPSVKEGAVAVPKHLKVESTIHVSEVKLDQLLLNIEELLSIKMNLHQRVSDLRRLEEAMKLWEKECQRNCTSRGSEGQQVFVKSLRHDLDQLKKLSEKDNRLVGTIVDSVLNDTKALLMQPCSTLLRTLPRMVRDISQSIGKEVNLEIVGGEIEIDRRILEKLKDPLIHIIRNSIDHGIELPEEREKKNKPRQGHIKIEVSQLGKSKVDLIITDDGSGVDIDKVKEKAVSLELFSPEELEGMSDKEIMLMIFHSGLSTSAIVTDLSGRGVGLEIVSENIEKINGKISIQSEKDRGTTTTLLLPLTLATFRGIRIKVCGYDFVVPTSRVVRVLRVPSTDVRPIENRETINIGGTTFSFVHLRQLLGYPLLTDAPSLFLLLIQSAENTIAFGVDEIVGEEEIFVKPLGKQLQNVRNISAATIMEWGRVIPILDTFDLVRNAIERHAAPPTTSTPVKDAEKQSRKTVLIAEDSITTRTLLRNIMEAAGYNVKTAKDGKEALSLLVYEEIDLLLSDVDMPRMNGFELTKRVRSMKKNPNLPIILCTSLGSREDRERGIEVGASAYIDKSSFMQSNLLDTARSLL